MFTLVQANALTSKVNQHYLRRPRLLDAGGLFTSSRAVN
jgi:hypothetical protein